MTCCTDLDFQNETIETSLSSEKTFYQSVKRLYAVMDLWYQRRIERKQLADVDARLLKDMGITSYQANREIKKPFWRK